MKRREFLVKSALATSGAMLATSLPLSVFASQRKDFDKIVNAYYLRAHTYTMVPHQVRDDLKWMAAIGTNTVSVGILEQDLFAAKENIEIICNEAGKLSMDVFAVPSRWGGLVAGAPKVPSVFTCQNPQTWVHKSNGKVLKSNISGCISSIHHPDTYEFMEKTTLKMLKTWKVKGVIWDELKTMGVDYSDSAMKAMGGKPDKDKQVEANVKFYSRLNQKIKKEFPDVSTHLFIHANVGQKTVEQLAKIEALDYFGCDGRPWTIEDGGKLESKGKVLLGKMGGQRFVDAAHRNGKKGLWLIENHNMSVVDVPILKKRLPEVIANSPEHLIYYYFPRNLENPYSVMNVFKKNLKSIK